MELPDEVLSQSDKEAVAKHIGLAVAGILPHGTPYVLLVVAGPRIVTVSNIATKEQVLALVTEYLQAQVAKTTAN